MRNLDYYVRLIHSSESDNNAYLSLIQQDISGGRITRQEIDTIKNLSLNLTLAPTDDRASEIQKSKIVAGFLLPANEQTAKPIDP